MFLNYFNILISKIIFKIYKHFENHTAPRIQKDVVL
jgi:hypothetical protein